MKNILKKTKTIIIIIIIIIIIGRFFNFIGFFESFKSSSEFAGIFYPKMVFDFHALEEQPPTAADDRLALGVYVSQGANSLKKRFWLRILGKKPYEKLYVKEMSYTWQEGEGVFFTDRVYYWTHIPEYTTNLEKIFKNKKPGDIFWFTLKIVFSFDDYDEPEQTQIFKYNIETVESEYFFDSFL